MSRRGENIRKRSDGRWEGRFFITDYETGKKKCKSVYAKTYADVKIKLVEAKYMVEKEVPVSHAAEQLQSAYPLTPTSGEDITFSNIASEWLLEISHLKKHSPISIFAFSTEADA